MSKPSLAIAYSMKRKKKASGGSVSSGDATMNYSKGGMPSQEEVDSFNEKHPVYAKIKNGLRGGQVKYAEGGEAEEPTQEENPKGELHGHWKSKRHARALKVAINYDKGGDVQEEADEDSLRSEEETKERINHEEEEKKKHHHEALHAEQPYAAGGDVECPSCKHVFKHGYTEYDKGEQTGAHELDMVGGARRKMSHGGQVANDTPAIVDGMPNQFDDLVLRDTLEDSHNTGADDGDEDGLVRRAMRRRMGK